MRSRGAALLRTAMYLSGGDREAAADLVQSTLVRAYVAWHRVRDLEARDAYVRRIMVRLSYRANRGTGRRLGLETQALSRATESSIERAVERQAIYGYLRSLSPRQRAVVVLRYYEDLSERQIAEALGCSVGTVKSHASRALAAIRTEMASASIHEGASDDIG